MFAILVVVCWYSMLFWDLLSMGRLGLLTLGLGCLFDWWGVVVRVFVYLSD